MTPDILELCRLCLVKDSIRVPIFEGEGDLRQLYFKIAACLPIKVQVDDELPKQICQDCLSKIELFHKFRITTVSAENQLLQWLQESSQDRNYARSVKLEHQDLNVEVEKSLTPVETVLDSRDEHQQNVPLVQYTTTVNQLNTSKSEPFPVHLDEDEDDEDDDDDQTQPMDDADDRDSDDEPLSSLELGASTSGVNATASTSNSVLQLPSLATISTKPNSDNTTVKSDMMFPAAEDNAATASGTNAGASSSGSYVVKMEPPDDVHDVQEITSCEKCLGIKINGECPICSWDVENNHLNETKVFAGRAPINGPVFHCPNCNSIFPSLTMLSSHYCFNRCRKCGETFTDIGSLMKHLQVHQDPLEYYCRICSYQTVDKHDYQKHARRHDYQSKYRCDVCFKGFISNMALNDHRNSHTGEKPHRCEVCGKMYSHKTNLISHKKTHSADGTPIFPCSKCKKCFRQKANLNTHFAAVHLGEVTFFTCEICGKKSLTKELMACHMRRHTGEKPFACLICDKRFRSLSNLYAHKRVHTKEKPFTCALCQKRYSQKSSLQIHMRIHTGEQPYSCPNCIRLFRCHSDLKRHSMLCGSKIKMELSNFNHSLI